MTLIDHGYYLERLPSVKAAGTLSAQLVGVQGRPAYPDVSADALLRAFRRSEIVFACIEIKARAMVDPRLTVERRQDDGTWSEDAGHPLRRVLMRPNSRMDEGRFWRAYVASRDLVGRFYAQKLTSAAGAIVGLNPLDPSKVSPRYDGDELVGYRWRSGRQVKDFKPDELLIWEMDDWSGPPALEVALGSVDADAAQTDYIRAFFNNAGVPSGVLTTDQELSQENADIIGQRFDAKYGRGGRRQGGTAVLGRGVRYEKAGANLDELDSESVRGTVESRICMAFGVPPLIVYAYIGLTRATYSNLKEAWAGFWDATLSPMLKEARGWLLWSLLPAFEAEDLIYAERVRLAWDLSQVAALQDDVDKVRGRAREDFRAGGITLNEYRAQIQQQPDPAGDYYLRGLALQAVPAGEAPEDQEAGAETRRGAGPGAIKALKTASVGTVERRIQARIERAARDVWKKIAEQVE